MEQMMIIRLQENLLTIRRLLNWSEAELGRRIGVTKQTVSNLEKRKSRMSGTQYIAIRTVIAEEIEHRPREEKQYLTAIVSALLDDNPSLPEDERLEIIKYAQLLAAAHAGGAESSELIREAWNLSSLARLMSAITLAAAWIGAGVWLSKLLKDD